MCENIKSLWSSLIDDDKLASQLLSINALEDVEEKAFALVTRMLFLLAMGMKKDRDNSVNDYTKLLNALHDCVAEVQCIKTCKISYRLKKILKIKQNSSADIINTSSANKTIIKNKNFLNKSRNQSKSPKQCDLFVNQTIKTPHIQQPDMSSYGETDIFDVPMDLDESTTHLERPQTPVQHINESTTLNTSPSLLGRVNRSQLFSPDSFVTAPSSLKVSKNLATSPEFISPVKKSSRNYKPGDTINFVSPKKQKKSKQAVLDVRSIRKNIDDVKVKGDTDILKKLNDADNNEKEKIQKKIKESLSSPQYLEMIQQKKAQLKETGNHAIPKQRSPLKPSRLSRNSHCSKQSQLEISPIASKNIDLTISSPKISPKLKRRRKNDETLLGEDEVLKSLEAESPVSNNVPDSMKKVIRRPNNFIDSFDYIPDKDNRPSYAHKGNVVRKRQERQLLDGWSCHECKEYYQSRKLTDSERKMAMNKCSKHRSKHNVITNTPRNFWNPDWDDDETQY